MHRPIINFTIFLAILLSGCATYPTIDTVDPSSLDNNQAVIVISTGEPSRCHFRHTINLGGPSAASGFSGQPATSKLEFNFTGEYSALHTVVVEPGTYRFYTAPLYSNWVEYVPVPQTELFDISGGEIRYVGEIYRTNCGSANFVIRDKGQRDISRLLEFVPEVDSSQISIEPLQFERSR